MSRARYQIVIEGSASITIQDVGGHRDLTVTNDAEAVVKELIPRLAGRRLFYYDSEGQMDELLVKDGRFAGFAPGPRP